MTDSNVSESAVQKQLQDIIEKQYTEILRLKSVIKEKEKWVSLDQYEVIVKELKNVKEAHLHTRTELMDTQDRLDFAQGEIEVLNKQLEREKAQFDQTFGNLKNKALKETVRNVELVNKCNVIEKEVEDTSLTLNQREKVIEGLSQQLHHTEETYKKQLFELNVQMQQDMYITQLMQGHEKKFKPVSSGSKDSFKAGETGLEVGGSVASGTRKHLKTKAVSSKR